MTNTLSKWAVRKERAMARALRAAPYYFEQTLKGDRSVAYTDLVLILRHEPGKGIPPRKIKAIIENAYVVPSWEPKHHRIRVRFYPQGSVPIQQAEADWTAGYAIR